MAEEGVAPARVADEGVEPGGFSSNWTTWRQTSDRKPDIETLAGKVAAAAAELDAMEQATAVMVARLLADGGLVPQSSPARALELPEDRIAETSLAGRASFSTILAGVVGFMGLTVLGMGDHRIHIGGHTLSARCACDTLFLPEVMGRTVEVTSRCPVTGQEIALTVGPGGVRGLRPLETVVSFLVPETAFGTDVIEAFCHFIHFFASAEAGVTWTAEHPGTFVISVDDAYRLGKLTNEARLAPLWHWVRRFQPRRSGPIGSGLAGGCTSFVTKVMLDA